MDAREDYDVVVPQWLLEFAESFGPFVLLGIILLAGAILLLSFRKRNQTKTEVL